MYQTLNDGHYNVDQTIMKTIDIETRREEKQQQNVVAIYAHVCFYSDISYSIYIDMEYCDTNLAEYLLLHGLLSHHETPITSVEIIMIMLHIANGVNFLHQHGEKHLNLTPR